jgi:hypothetical protein
VIKIHNPRPKEVLDSGIAVAPNTIAINKNDNSKNDKLLTITIKFPNILFNCPLIWFIQCISFLKTTIKIVLQLLRRGTNLNSTSRKH